MVLAGCASKSDAPYVCGTYDNAPFVNAPGNLCAVFYDGPLGPTVHYCDPLPVAHEINGVPSCEWQVTATGETSDAACAADGCTCGIAPCEADADGERYCRYVGHLPNEVNLSAGIRKSADGNDVQCWYNVSSRTVDEVQTGESGWCSTFNGRTGFRICL